ncbi:putative bifunctional diguanylate cyclase/phosphodiesterase [Desulfovermiculus halophilus]|uniref:putative bifunctional diguanylate cyclase/phosphodiesterase n=1 Tax=Desulfovermiculus halophilus TaxID=339722 RepID=UPI0024467AEB|nr:GGDEF domain-containing phosphodiesterase [Desulfovermiculus halophilus]
MTDSSPKHTGILLQSLLDRIARPLNVHDVQGEVIVTASAGISWYPTDGNQGTDLVQKAETAMGRAKESGIQRVEFFTSDMQASSLESLRLHKDLLDALEQEQFTLFFQPQIDLATDGIAGAEALVRWHHPDGKIVGPQDFIPILEDMGRIQELGEFVLNQGCDALQRINEAGLDLPRMAINLAAPQLEDPDLGSKLAKTMQASGIPPEQLELEVTESLLISRFELVQNQMSELLGMGISVALDDFGTGYSSLQYLTRYPFSKLKIDKSFVWNMAKGDKDYEVVKAIISLGHSLQIKVLAEGVEDKRHEQTLRTLGCELVQGYLYSPPIDFKAFVEYLRKYSHPGQED